jgi:nucleoside-diphosphate-sugar epimerase
MTSHRLRGMSNLINSVEELEDLLSTPSPQDIDTFRNLKGDLLVVGVGGKIGPSLVRRAGRAAQAAGRKMRVIGTDVHCEELAMEPLEEAGVEILCTDLLNPDSFAGLPDVENVIFMAGRKFGSTGGESLTWAMNVYVPALVADRYRKSRIVAFSSGNIYPFTPIVSGGATESVVPAPIGEYAQSVLGRERMFEYFSGRNGTAVAMLRLNYAVELRYGVLLDIGNKVFEGKPVDLTMGAANVMWQGDVNSITLRSLAHCQSPPFILNMTGPETLSVRAVAKRFGEFLGKDVILEGQEAPNALLNNAAKCHRMFGYPSVSIDQIIEWIANWIKIGGWTLNKPTHFETRDGKF